MKIIVKLFSLKLLTSFLALAYSIIQVRYFGASRIIEIFFAAQSLIYLVTSLTQSGQLAEIFLPEFQRLNNIKKGLGFDALNIIIIRMFFWGCLIISLVFIFTPFFINLLVPGFSNEDKELAALIFRILLPYLFFQINNSFFVTVLNAEEKFGRAEFLGISSSLVNIICLVMFFPFVGIWALVISLLLGKFLEFIFYSRELYKIGFKFRFLLSISDFDHRSFFKTMQSTFMYVGATQIYSIVLTAAISFLPEGTYAIFKYVQNLRNKLNGLFMSPFITIFFTRYSKLLQKSKSVLRELNKNIESIINVNTIIIIGGVLIGDLFLEIIWGSSKFDNSDVKLAYMFLLFSICSILISGIGNIYRKMAVANERGKKLYNFWVISQLSSALFSYLLINYLSIYGLFFVIPLNSFLLGFASYIVYLGTKNSVSYNFLKLNDVIMIVLVVLSMLSKFFLFRHSNFDNKIIFMAVLICILFSLIIYPLLKTYKLWIHEKNNG